MAMIQFPTFLFSALPFDACFYVHCLDIEIFANHFKKKKKFESGGMRRCYCRMGVIPTDAVDLEVQVQNKCLVWLLDYHLSSHSETYPQCW